MSNEVKMPEAEQTALAEMTKALGGMSEQVERMAKSLEVIADRLAPPTANQNEAVDSTRRRAASLRSAMLGSDPATTLSALWNGEALTAITINGEPVSAGFVIARQSAFESAPTEVTSAGTAKPQGLDDDEPIVSLQFMETNSGPALAYAGPIFKS